MLKGAAPTLASSGVVAVYRGEDAMTSTQSEVKELLESWWGAARIKHEHVSLPVDFNGGRAVMDAVP
jgi:hypothetical protein